MDFWVVVGDSAGNHVRMIMHRQLPDEWLRRLGGTQALGKVVPYWEIYRKEKEKLENLRKTKAG